MESSDDMYMHIDIEYMNLKMTNDSITDEATRM